MTRYLAILMMVGLLAGCATADKIPLENAPPAAVGVSDYHLGPSDKLRLIVFGEDNLSGEFTISPAGNIAIPLIGDAHAAELTAPQLQSAIAARLSQGYVRDPRVSVEVLTYRPFYVLGEVNKPGVYPFEFGLTVQKAVATAQGYTYRANEREVFIKHAGEDSEHRYRVTSSTVVAPGDVVRIGERYF